MIWYYYLVFAFVVLWLATSLILYIKQRAILYKISLGLPILLVVGLIIIVLAILLLPIIYLFGFIISMFLPNYEIIRFGKKIDIE